MEFEHDGRDRLKCSNSECGWVHWNNPTPVVAAIVERNENVVLVRNVGWPKSWFGLVTGFLEANEAPEDGICREIQEELGLEVVNPRLIGVYPFRRMNQVIIAYHVEAHEGEICIDPEEIAEYREIPLRSVRPWRAGTGYALLDFLKERGFRPKFLGED